MLLLVEMSPRMVQKSPKNTENNVRHLAGLFCLGQAEGLENYFGTSQTEGSANTLWASQAQWSGTICRMLTEDWCVSGSKLVQVESENHSVMPDSL